MKRFWVSLLSVMMMVACVFAIPTLPIFAAEDGTITVTANTASCEIGTEITVTVTVTLGTQCTSKIILGQYNLNYNGALVSYNGDTSGAVAAEVFDENTAVTTYSQQYTFVANAEGTAEFSVSGVQVFFDVPFEGRDQADLAASPVMVTINPQPTTTEATTEASTEESTEASTEASTEESTEASTEASTEESTEGTTEIPKSADANLKSLAIYPGALLERFAPDKTAYTAQIVANDVTTLIVGLETSDPNATFTIVGNTNLKVGDNVITITVTAQDKVTQMVYTISVTREERAENPTNPVEPTEPSTEETTTETNSTEESTEEGSSDVAPTDIELDNVFGGQSMYLISDWGNDVLYEDFEVVDDTYQGMPVKVAVSKEGMKLYFLSDLTGDTKEFYVYDEVSDCFFPYYVVTPNEGRYVLLNGNDPELTAGLPMVKLHLNDGPEYSAWSLSGDVSDNVFLVYAMQSDGKTAWFRFDANYGTLVRYFADKEEVPSTEEKPMPSQGGNENLGPVVESLVEANRNEASKHNAAYNDLVTKYNQDIGLRMKIIIGIMIALVFIFIVAIILAFKLRAIYRDYDFVDEDEDAQDEEDEDERKAKEQETKKSEEETMTKVTAAMKSAAQEQKAKSQAESKQKRDSADGDNFEFIEF